MKKDRAYLCLLAVAGWCWLAAPVGAQTPNDDPPDPGGPSMSDVVLHTSGLIKLGIRDEGHLNVVGGEGIASIGSGSTIDAGLRLVFPNGDEAEATAPGCLCEGWGASGDAVSGGASVDLGGVFNLSNITFASDGTAATSTVDVGATLRVTHDYHPSADTPNLYESTVTIENISGAPLADVRYRRVMDWDIQPFTFNECVTISSGTATDLAFVTNNGFDGTDPLSPPAVDPGPDPYFSIGDRVDDGPRDHGALFQFEFGALGVGESMSFNIYYGAGFTQAEAAAALAAVGAEAFSYGKPAIDFEQGPPFGDGECDSDPENVFIFAFSGIGGEPDTEPPLCFLSDFDPGPPMAIEVTTQDLESGLDQILVTVLENATVTIPPFMQGTNDVVLVTAEKTDPALPAHLELAVLDVFGNETVCDPVLVRLEIPKNAWQVSETFRGIPEYERFISLQNGSPGVHRFQALVNRSGRYTLPLRPGQEALIDVTKSMIPGDNTIRLSASGAPGSWLVVLISDGVGGGNELDLRKLTGVRARGVNLDWRGRP